LLNLMLGIKYLPNLKPDFIKLLSDSSSFGFFNF
jgi:hypothetical protein